MQLNLFRIAYPVTALGPGKRVAIWVAGCRKRCKGCISPEMQSPSAGEMIDTAVLADHILHLPHELDGITISGGEPFDQPLILADFVVRLKQARPDWTVMIYSGYVLRTIKKKDECRLLLEMTDILVDGPYREQIPSLHKWTGSGNQRVYVNNNRYRFSVHNDQSPKEVGLGYGTRETIIIGTFDTRLRKNLHNLLCIDKAAMEIDR